jgi:hypothetical protein
MYQQVSMLVRVKYVIGFDQVSTFVTPNTSFVYYGFGVSMEFAFYDTNYLYTTWEKLCFGDGRAF